MIDNALLTERELARFERPTPLTLATYREAVFGTRKGESMVSGSARSLLEDEKDLIALHKSMDGDILSRAIRRYWPFPGSVSKACLFPSIKCDHSCRE
jgi:hypothetical protein